jgi:CspA family cold shock protein
MRQRGFVKSYDLDAGFGFIQSSQGEELFVHHAGLLAGLRGLERRMEVEFEVNEPGRATSVVPVVTGRTNAASA